MSTKFKEMFGEILLEHNESNNQVNQIPADQLDGKHIGLYFGAYSSSECRSFTPKLAAYVKGLNSMGPEQLEIIFISTDKDPGDFDKYFKEMPWKALPFSDRERSKALAEKFHVKDIPTIISLAPSGEPEEKYSFDVELVRVTYTRAVSHWCKGKRFFGTREPREGEYAWSGIICHQCYMCPIIGTRYGCTHDKCCVDLCEACAPKFKHEHPIVEYLTPTLPYSFEQIFQSVPYLLSPDSDEKIETKTLWENDVKCIGFYRSSLWCEPCREFTPILKEVYKKAQEKTLPFRLVYVPSAFDDESFNEYRSHLPWPAIPLHSQQLISTYLYTPCIPKLFIVSSDGKVLTRYGVEIVQREGYDALEAWTQGIILPPPDPNKYEWTDVSCTICNMNPIIGQRYCCCTCDTYDLCSACEKTNHEHEHKLERVLQSGENDLL